ncbi:VanZ family protein [Humibacter ginsenosidimutans]|uniref:VanZ family protein n=1 Tax=Humibacter ginsenosidimutans TaxID=2599293 RepID=A0A5B8M5T5_9MICO|nr:VanZ family protein [Humibacter ginsenosidimutans]QDZ16148.1 VanZ family protein [Humibacter ginsenosidimutans]
MGDQVWLALIAVSIGVVAAVLLFIPFVFISHRRRGRVTLGRALLWFAALVYFWAIWVYTLLPLPDPENMRCAGVNLDVFTAVRDLATAAGHPGSMLTNPVVLQLVLNVALFVPLGFFVRVLGGRGWLLATLLGLGVSLLIEFTQLTGVWGLYPCAYRVFDVDDLATNTLGALLGSLAALVVPARLRGMARSAEAGSPRAVTRGRRIVAVICDGLGAMLAQLVVAVLARMLLLTWGHAALEQWGDLAGILSTALIAAALLALVLVTGGTLGDIAVEIRYTGGRLTHRGARLLRYAGGIGGFVVLQMLPAPWSALTWLFGAASLILLFTTDHGRGLPGLVSGTRVVDARAAVAETASGSSAAASVPHDTL